MMEKLIELVERYPDLAEKAYPIVGGISFFGLLFISSILILDGVQKRNRKRKNARRRRKCYKNI